MSGYKWDTYTHLSESGMLDGVETVPWEAGGEQFHYPEHAPLADCLLQYILLFISFPIYLSALPEISCSPSFSDAFRRGHGYSNMVAYQ